MVQVDNALLNAVWPRCIDLGVIIVALPSQAMQAQQIAILGLYNVLLGPIAVQLAELDKVGCVPQGGGDF